MYFFSDRKAKRLPTELYTHVLERSTLTTMTFFQKEQGPSEHTVSAAAKMPVSTAAPRSNWQYQQVSGTCPAIEPLRQAFTQRKCISSSKAAESGEIYLYLLDRHRVVHLSVHMDLEPEICASK